MVGLPEWPKAHVQCRYKRNVPVMQYLKQMTADAGEWTWVLLIQIDILFG